MKKTINIHLGRQLFIIEEDAYARLNAYLEKLKSSFASEEGAEEIVEDIEMRCAELIQNLLN
jgi:DNA replication initiation complex subunit (GINS family)